MSETGETEEDRIAGKKSEGKTLHEINNRWVLGRLSWSTDGLWWIHDRLGVRHYCLFSTAVVHKDGIRAIEIVLWRFRWTVTWNGFAVIKEEKTGKNF